MILPGFPSVATAIVLAGMLAGCASYDTPVTAPASGAPASVPAPGTSWIDRSARHQDLIYVADPTDGFMRVYSLNRRRLVGLLYQSNEPNGLCVDAANDIFVTGLGGGSIYEYAHGVKKPETKLVPPASRSMSCSVDPTTGNLAVTAFESDSGAAGNVAIYPKAQGSPTIYKDPAFYEYFFCGYDGAGNLFVDGLAPSGTGGGFVFAELRKGSNAFTNITLTPTINQPGQVQWDGTYVAVGDTTTTNIYRFAILGSTGTLQGTTSLEGATTINDFTIHAPDVLVSNAYQVHSGDYTDALFYAYPAGGKVRKEVANGKYSMEGVAVSLHTDK